jgi:hypothetical protein
MPLKYKLPGYLGNALLVVLGLIVAAQGSLLTGIMLSALGILNVYLVYKLDSYSQPEAALAHELEMKNYGVSLDRTTITRTSKCGCLLRALDSDRALALFRGFVCQ